MNVFAEYATYYNALYADKNYRPEADFVLQLAHEAGVQPRTLLDLGCGTARHAIEMARQGVAVTGVDMSQHMLAHAEQLLDEAFPASSACCPRPELVEGDACRVRLGRQFDMVTSLFHVMSYQTATEDALGLLSTAYEHLTPGGIFIFDFWYGPCVLHERPEYREKILESQNCRIRRTANPELFLNENRVDVHYEIILENKDRPPVHLEEVHSMRYWFLPELRYLSRQAGFSLLGEGVWMSRDVPSDKSWGVWMRLKK